MRRYLTRASQILLDLVTLAVAFALAFFLRFEFTLPTTMVGRLFLVGPYVVGFEYLILVGFGVHRFSWRYVGLREAMRIVAAITASTAVLVASRLIAGELQYTYGYLRHGVIPFGVIAGNYILAFVGVTGVRVVRRIIGEKADTANRLTEGRGEPVPTLLVGAGQAGMLVARELSARPELGLRPIGFLDDDPGKIGLEVHGVRVLGPTGRLPDIAAKHGPEQVLITMASAPGADIRRINDLCEQVELPVKIIPGLYEIVGGQVNLSRIRDVAIEDLLRREPVELETDTIARLVRDRVVLVTGAGGSIGAELCRQVCGFAPSCVVLVERAEGNLFSIHRELQPAHREITLVPRLGDVTHCEQMSALFAEHKPAVVLHAAAHKHVPMLEENASEAVRNNVSGTQVVADLAHAHNVETFVMISTDKAVNPSSIMGATKRVAEMYVQSLASTSDTRFVTVRFGNVLGSTGSVVPIFKEQIANGGPVTVTDPEMYRYFMTIPEACQLVLQAGSMGQGGEIFVLDMGEPVRIYDLARDLIALSGLKEGIDIEIQVTGARPGEKRFEELATDAEHAEKTRHPKIFIGQTSNGGADDLAQPQMLQRLQECRTHGEVVSALSILVREFRGGSGRDTGAASGAKVSESGPTPAPEPRRRVASDAG